LSGWPWIALLGLGAFHGLNPAMGWLFAVARGLQSQSRAVVLRSMVPIAAGHALSIAIVVAVIVALREWVEIDTLRLASAAVLIAFGAYRLVARHRGRAGMQIGAFQLLLWSFLMATAHGAGLMLIPVFLAAPAGTSHAQHAHLSGLIGSDAGTASLAVGVHTLAMLVVSAAIAVAVYEWVGLAFLRRGWINLDVLWAMVLIGVGALLLVMARA
jgi:hypothetical protein